MMILISVTVEHILSLKNEMSQVGFNPRHRIVSHRSTRHQLSQRRYLLAQLEEVIIDLLWFIYPYVGERSFYIRYA